MKKNNDEIIDLIDKNYYEDIEANFLARNFGQVDENKELNLKTGNIVEFWSGYNNDIRYRTKILGFDKDGSAFMYWNCYWFPVRLKERDYKHVTTQE